MRRNESRKRPHFNYSAAESLPANSNESSAKQKKRPRLQLEAPQESPMLITRYRASEPESLTSPCLQENLLTLLSFDNKNAPDIRSRVNASNFEGLYRQIAGPVCEYIDKYGHAPGMHLPDLFADILENEKNDRKTKQYKRVLKWLYATKDEVNPKFVMDNLDRFIRFQNHKSAIMDAIEIVRQTENPINEQVVRLDKIFADVANSSPLLEPSPQPLDLTTDDEPEPARWLIDQWLPAGYVSLLSGHGGSGKSHIALAQAICIASGTPWLGQPVRRRRVVFLSCEDDEAVLKSRIHHICRHLGIDSTAIRRRLRVFSLVGRDTIIWQERSQRGSTWTTTEKFDWLRNILKTPKTRVLFVDGIADVFAGNENDRAQVKAFVNSMLGLTDTKGAVVLIGHVPKPTASNPAASEGYSGSTQWHNAVRARWYLRREKDGQGGSDGGLILTLQKSNLGPVGAQARYRWDDDEHTFVGEMIDRAREERARAGVELKSIVAAMKVCKAINTPVPVARRGPSTTYHILAETGELAPSLDESKKGKAKFWQRLAEARERNYLKEDVIRRDNRHPMQVWTLQNRAGQGEMEAE